MKLFEPGPVDVNVDTEGFNADTVIAWAASPIGGTVIACLFVAIIFRKLWANRTFAIVMSFAMGIALVLVIMR